MKGVGVFYPASKFDLALLEQGCDRLRQQGVITLKKPPLPKDDARSFRIGTREERLASLLEVLRDPLCEVLWAARGGYGSVELLPHLPQEASAWRGKQVLGYSDVTSLHAFLSNLGEASYHGHMLATRGWQEAEGADLAGHLDLLAGRPLPGVDCQGQAEARGRLVGGNLCTLVSLMGTPWQLRLEPGDVLFLEDINEPAYKLARSLYQLSHTENFRRCTILWGHLTHCTAEGESVLDLISSLMKAHDVPYAHSLQAGHARPNHCLRLGAPVELKAGRLNFL